MAYQTNHFCEHFYFLCVLFSNSSWKQQHKVVVTKNTFVRSACPSSHANASVSNKNNERHSVACLMADECTKGQKKTTTPTQRALGTSCRLQLRETTLASLFINIRFHPVNLCFCDVYTKEPSFWDTSIDFQNNTLSIGHSFADPLQR